MQKSIIDSELGNIVLRKNLRARHYTIRWNKGKVSVTLPAYGSYRQALEFVFSHKDRLIKQIQARESKEISKEEEIELRKKAKAYLPEKLHNLSVLHGFSYNSVKITKSRTRWGSCSSKTTINLSLFLMLLPEHLIDYVLLHELCHTVHMNHGPEFWLLLDRVTDNQAHKLRKELKNHHH